MSRIKEFFSEWRYWKICFYVIFTASLIYILYFIIQNLNNILSVVGSVFVSIMTALSPLFIGLVLAYLISPLVDIVDNKFMSKIFFKTPSSNAKRAKHIQFRRTVSILLTFLFIIIGIIMLIYAFAFLIVGRLVFDSLTGMLESIAIYFSHYEVILEDLLEKLPESGLDQHLDNLFNDIALWISEHFSADAVINLVTNFGVGLVNITLGIVLAIYMIKDKDFFIRLWRKTIHILLPMKYSARLNETLHDVDMVFSRFLRGQLLDALIVAVITSIVLTIIGLDFAVILGCFAGLTNVIPYFGPVFGAIPAVLVALLTGGLSKAILTIVVFIIIQQIDSDLIYPKVVGSSTGLHPVFVLLSVTFGGYYWGIVGMVLAVPIAGCIRLFIMRKFDLEHE